MVLEAMASVYGALGFRRKEAYVLREVLGCIMDLIVCGREEAQAGAGRTGGTGLGTPSPRRSGATSRVWPPESCRPRLTRETLAVTAMFLILRALA